MYENINIPHQPFLVKMKLLPHYPLNRSVQRKPSHATSLVLNISELVNRRTDGNGVCTKSRNSVIQNLVIQNFVKDLKGGGLWCWWYPAEISITSKHFTILIYENIHYRRTAQVTKAQGKIARRQKCPAKDAIIGKFVCNKCNDRLIEIII